MKKRRLLALLLAFILLLPAVSVSAGDYVGPPDGIVNSGSCGDNVTWTMYSDGTLNISGTGAMPDDYSNPWNNYQSSITTVIVEEGITHIGACAFDGYSSLTSVSLPSTLTSIGKLAFHSCTSLQTIDIPDSVNTIGERAFSVSGLTSFDVPESLTVIPHEMLYDCSSLKTVTIGGNTLTSIGEEAFWYCTALEEITIPASVTSIGKYAFDNCPALLNINILSEAPATIGDRTFYTKNAATTIHVPAGTAATYKTSWPAYASQIVEPNSGTCGTNLTWNFDLETGTLTISGTGGMKNFSSNSAPWYDYVDEITSVVIEEGVTSIGKYAFFDCKAMTSAFIPYTLSVVDAYAFNNTTALTNIYYNGTKSQWIGNIKRYCQSGNGYLMNEENIHPLMADGFSGENKPTITATATVQDVVEFRSDKVTELIVNKNAPKLEFTLDSFKNAADGSAFEVTVTLDKAKFITNAITAISKEEAVSLFSCTKTATTTILTTAESTFVPVGYDGWIDMNGNSYLDSKDLLLTVEINEAENQIRYTVFAGKDITLAQGSKFAINLQSQLTETKPGTDATVTISGDVCNGETAVFCQVLPDVYAINSLRIKETAESSEYLESIPQTAFTAEVNLTKGLPDTSNTLVLAGYDTGGRMVFLQYQNVAPADAYNTIYNIAVANTNGKIAKLNVFFISQTTSREPLAQSVSFPA